MCACVSMCVRVCACVCVCMCVEGLEQGSIYTHSMAGKPKITTLIKHYLGSLEISHYTSSTVHVLLT